MANAMQDRVWLDAALEIGARAGALLSEGQGGPFDIHTKGETTDLVTSFDRAAEALIVEGLRAHFPSHRILAEEGGEHPGDDGAPCWIIDPIDGTTNFAHGLPMYCVSIALAVQGVLRVGVLVAPALRWQFAARRGHGATLNGQRLTVSSTHALENALLATGFPYDRKTSPNNNFAQFVALKRQARGIRRFGSAALDLALVAAGRFDGYWEMKLKPWDVAAGILLVQEAGGHVTNWQGQPVDLSQGEVLASNGLLHPQILAALAAAS